MTAAATEIKQGTSLEVLAPYLPYGIEVENKYAGRGTLAGLHTKGALALYPRVKEPEMSAYPNLLPVLLPFSALCTPLEDDTVPAVEVAKLASGWRESMGCPEPKVMFSTFGNPVFVQVDSEHVRIYESGHVEYRDSDKHYPVYNQAAIVDYFRSKHFALPVNGRTLFEGVDYIAKQPAAHELQSPAASPTV
jgi:hypothetical protein